MVDIFGLVAWLVGCRIDMGKIDGTGEAEIARLKPVFQTAL